MTFLPFGLDGEMTAADLDSGGRLIQIGVTVAVETGRYETFTSLINPGEHHWDQVAEAVHGIAVEQVAAAPAATDVDDALYQWLIDHGANPTRTSRTLAVGFNVGSFDLPHLAMVLPRSAALFSRRSIDLNALCFTLDGANGPDGNPWAWKTWKRTATAYAVAHLAGHPAAAHDAGYDAQLHLLAWHWLRDAVRGTFQTIPDIDTAPTVADHARLLLDILGAAEASAATGVPEVFLVQWAGGGRATRTEWIHAVTAAAERLSGQTAS